MIGTTRVSKRPDKGKTGVFPLEDGRWAYFVDGLVRFTCYSREKCEERAAAASNTRSNRAA